MPYLFKCMDESFAERVKVGDIVIAGLNFAAAVRASILL